MWWEIFEIIKSKIEINSSQTCRWFASLTDHNQFPKLKLKSSSRLRLRPLPLRPNTTLRTKSVRKMTSQRLAEFASPTSPTVSKLNSFHAPAPTSSILSALFNGFTRNENVPCADRASRSRSNLSKLIVVSRIQSQLRTKKAILLLILANSFFTLFRLNPT